MQLRLNPNKKKKNPKIVREPQAHGTSNIQKKTKRWKLDVLNHIVVT